MSYLKNQEKAGQIPFPMLYTVKNMIWIGIFCFLFTSSVFGQEKNWQITLTNGKVISNIFLQQVEGDSIALASVSSATTIMKWIPVDSITELRHVKKSKFWKGAGIGFVAGATVGALIGWATYEKPAPNPDDWFPDLWEGPEYNAIGGGILGAPVGFLLGGIIGASMGRDEIYDFSKMNHKQKLNLSFSLVLKKE